MSTANNLQHWASAVVTLQQSGSAYVLVTLLGSRGSTPRDDGTKMVFAADYSVGTIGGGHLEYTAATIAAQMLAQDQDAQKIEYFPLGPSLGQCCGGSATVLFECFSGNRFNIALFGAGHVGQALAGILAQLPCQLHWIDSREQQHPNAAPDNVQAIISDAPELEVADMPAGSDYLIMTHNHQMDYAILEAVLKRGDARYIGLIGSHTKWRRFALRLAHRGFSAVDYDAVRCPAGLAAVPGKAPIEVAVSIAGELIAVQHAAAKHAVKQRGMAAREVKKIQLLLASQTPPTEAQQHDG